MSRSFPSPAGSGLPRRTALALTAVVALGGCRSGLEQVAGLDGLPCIAGIGAPRVYVDVVYGEDGMPDARPEVCEVRRGTVVAWRGPPAADVPFVISFKGESPVAGQERGVFSSRPGERHRVERLMDAPPGRYEYGIIANGRERDPAIIIR